MIVESCDVEFVIHCLICRYKAHFRWEHYVRNGEIQVESLPKETDPCASVTAAFLKVR